MLAGGAWLLGCVVGGLLSVGLGRAYVGEHASRRGGRPGWMWCAGICPLTAALFLAAWWEFGNAAGLLRAFVLICVLIALSVTDLLCGLLPNAITVPATLVGLALSAVAGPHGWWTYPLSAAIVGGGLFAVAAFYPGGMGMGDVKMGAVLGAFLGPFAALAVFLGALCGAGVGGALLLSGRIGRDTGLPFGVFLAFGALLALFFGAEMCSFYADLAWPGADR